jgi:DNA repair exonuclease SbcCD ATPase subunit
LDFIKDQSEKKRDLFDKILNIRSAIVTMSLKTKSFMEFKLRQSYFQNEAFALEDRLADNKRKMGSLRDRLYQINNFNDDIFDILEKSLSYLKETVDPYLREVDCPVCGDSHERKALLGKIERKLTQGSKKVKELKKKLFLENQNAVRIIDHYQIEERGLKDNLARRIKMLKNLMINNSFLEIKNTEELKKEISELLERKDSLEAEFNKYNLKADSCYPEILQQEKESKNMLADCKRAQSRIKNLESELEKQQELLQQNKVRKQLKEVENEFKKAAAEREKIKRGLERAEKLKLAVRDVVADLNDQILKEQEEFINKIFKRIYPHPFFRQINLKTTVSRQGSNSLLIECKNKSGKTIVNPAFTFSKAQVNIVAISIFLSMALRQQCTKLNTILLDDPMQSMDDLNIISFIDVLRSCSMEGGDLNKQLVLSTHDDKFYRLLLKKFRFLSAVGYYFETYDEDGPGVRSWGIDQ